MNTSRGIITVLCVATLVSIALVAWQAGALRSLRTEQVALREDLRQALAARGDAASASMGGQAEKEQLELIKLRHEVRQLREGLAEARASQPAGLKGLVQSVFPSAAGAPLRVPPEWKFLEQNLTNQYAAIMQGVNNGTNEYIRFLNLSRAAKLSLTFGFKKQAREFAEDAMTLNEKFSRGAPEKLNGDVVHDANLVLGRLAADEGRMEDAKRFLLASGKTKGSPTLNSFGPNMSLAKDLLERGEQATVLQYFELCRRFWNNDEKLDEWKKDVEAGRIPNFSANLIH